MPWIRSFQSHCGSPTAEKIHMEKQTRISWQTAMLVSVLYFDGMYVANQFHAARYLLD